MERTIRYQPFSAVDNDYEPLLAFVREQVGRLIPGFDPSAARTPEWIEPEGEQHYWSRRGWKEGDGTRGFAVTFRQTIEPRADGIALSGVTVEAYGIPAGCGIQITCERSWFDPRYLEMRVSGPEATVTDVVRAFETEFGPIAERTPDDRDLDIDLTGIKSALRWRQWDAVKLRAAYILRFRPDDADALFALGTASGATGDAKRALELLTRSVELSPRNHDAWYNLGIAHIETGNPDKAVKALERALLLSPGNEDVEKQLSRARKLAPRQ